MKKWTFKIIGYVTSYYWPLWNEICSSYKDIKQWKYDKDNLKSQKGNGLKKRLIKCTYTASITFLKRYSSSTYLTPEKLGDVVVVLQGTNRNCSVPVDIMVICQPCEYDFTMWIMEHFIPFLWRNFIIEECFILSKVPDKSRMKSKT